MLAIRWSRLASIAALVICAAASASAQLKVATVNLQKALADTAEIKAAEAELKTKFGPAQDQLAALEVQADAGGAGQAGNRRIGLGLAGVQNCVVGLAERR